MPLRFLQKFWMWKIHNAMQPDRAEVSLVSQGFHLGIPLWVACEYNVDSSLLERSLRNKKMGALGRISL